MSEDRVDRPALERSLAALVARTALPPEQGFFGPRSFAWRMFRERALASYAPRAVMLQYAYPPFAAASASYGADAEPGARFGRAVSTLLSMIFGDRDRVLRDARRLHLMHDRLHGVLVEGSPRLPVGTAYHGNDRASLAWILVTLLDASIRGYERHVGAIDEGALFDDVVRFAALFGLASGDVPDSRRALDTAIADAVTSTLVVGNEARAMWVFLVTAERRRERVGRHTIRGWAAATLPAPLRESLGSRMNEGRARAIERAGLALRASLLPPRWRYVDAYRAAELRV